MKKPAFLNLISLFLTVVFLLSAAPRAYAQIEFIDLSKRQSDVLNRLNAGISTPEDRTLVTQYFQNYELGRWLGRDAEVNIPDYREKLSDVLLRLLGSNQESGRLAADLVLQGLKKLVTDRQPSPPIKYNAVLLAGQLNEARDGNSLTAYVPAHDFLMQVMGQQNMPAYLKVAALQGLRLQSGRNLPAAKRNALAPIFANYAFTAWQANELAEVTWMRELGIEGLGALRVAGTNGEYTDKLVAIMEDGKSGIPMETRLAAAVALSRFTQPGGKKKPVEIYESIAKLTAEAITLEYKRELKLQRGILPGQKVTRSSYSPSQTLTPEQEQAQIRSLRQRVMGVTAPMIRALNVNQSSLAKSLSASDQEWARPLMRELNELKKTMDRIGAAPKGAIRDQDSNFNTTDSLNALKYDAVRAEVGEHLTKLYRHLKMDPAALRLPTKPAVRRP